jgi:hypothetical protein
MTGDFPGTYLPEQYIHARKTTKSRTMKRKAARVIGLFGRETALYRWQTALCGIPMRPNYSGIFPMGQQRGLFCFSVET